MTKKREREAEGGEREASNPEATERKRLKDLAFSNNMLCETQARSSIHLNPSPIVTKHHGKDIIKKSQRRSSRYLFSFPALFAPIAGGKIGDLKDLGTKNPILYLDFPQVLLLLLPFSLFKNRIFGVFCFMGILCFCVSRHGKEIGFAFFFGMIIIILLLGV